MAVTNMMCILAFRSFQVHAIFITAHKKSGRVDQMVLIKQTDSDKTKLNQESSTIPLCHP